jgi:hypothetical protein
MEIGDDARDSVPNPSTDQTGHRATERLPASQAAIVIGCDVVWFGVLARRSWSSGPVSGSTLIPAVSPLLSRASQAVIVSDGRVWLNSTGFNLTLVKAALDVVSHASVPRFRHSM